MKGPDWGIPTARGRALKGFAVESADLGDWGLMDPGAAPHQETKQQSQAHQGTSPEPRRMMHEGGRHASFQGGCLNVSERGVHCCVSKAEVPKIPRCVHLRRSIAGTVLPPKIL